MRVKLCQQCGYQLPRRARHCAWCQAPVKNRTALTVSILAVFALPMLLAWYLGNNRVLVFPPPETTRPTVVKINREDPPIKKSRKNVSTIYVKGQIVNLRKNPFLESQTIRQLKKGQRLTQVSRSGNWLQVLEDGAGDRPGWVHASLVGKIKPLSSKAHTEEKAFKLFRESFDRFNNEIKSSKGMAFFNDVEYLNQGVIQVTATDILLSAPKRFKEKYLVALMEMWLEVRETTQPATVRIVDQDGHLRLEEVQN